MPRAEPSSAAEKAPLLVGNPPGSYGAAAHDDSVEAPAPPTASASAAAPRSSTGDDGGERRATWEGPSRGISEIFRSLPCGEMLRTHGKFLGVLLAVELLILFWALLKPETRCHGQCDWGENDPCTDLKPVHCFPDWRSYFTVGVVLATLGVMSNGTPPDVAMLVATLLLILTKVISREEAYQGLSDPGPLTVACMFIVARALQSVGVIRFLAQALEKVENVSIRLALLWLCLPVVALSAFINNTPIVAALIPLVEEWSGSLDVSPSKLPDHSSTRGIRELGGRNVQAADAAVLRLDARRDVHSHRHFDESHRGGALRGRVPERGPHRALRPCAVRILFHTPTRPPPRPHPFN